MNFACIDENARASSAAPKRFRPLGQPRNTEVKEKRRARSANPTLASRNLERQDEEVSKPEIKQAEQVPKSAEKQDEQVSSEHEEQQDEHVFEPEENPEISKSDGKQAVEVSGEVKKQQPEVDIASKTDEDDLSLGTLLLYYRNLFVPF